MYNESGDMLEDLSKSSRFTVINQMREKANLQPLLWERFKLHSWKLIEELTEDARVQYNNSLETRER